MQFHEGIVIESLVAQVHHERRRILTQRLQHCRMIVEIAELIIAEFAQRGLQPLDRRHVLRVELAAQLDGIGQSRIAQQDGDLGERNRTMGDARRLVWGGAGQEHAARHHAEILITRGMRRRFFMKPYVGKPCLFQQIADGLPRIQAFGIELVGDYALFRIDHDFAADQAGRIVRQRAFPAHQLRLVYPFPGPAFEISGHPFAVGEIHHERTAGSQRALYLSEDLPVVLDAVEIPEGISHHHGAVERAFRRPELAGIAFAEGRRHGLRPGTPAGQADQISRTVDPGNVAKTATGEFEGVTPLTAAQIEHAVVRHKTGRGNQQIDVLTGIFPVLDNIAIGFEVQGVEKAGPPVAGQMSFEIRERTVGAAARQRNRTLRILVFHRPTKSFVVCAANLACPLRLTRFARASLGQRENEPRGVSIFHDDGLWKWQMKVTRKKTGTRNACRHRSPSKAVFRPIAEHHLTCRRRQTAGSKD